MAQIRPEDLSAVPGGEVSPAAAVIIDDGDGVWKATPAEIVESALPATLGIDGGAALIGMEGGTVQSAITATSGLLFSEMSSATIPTSINQIRTQGYSATGVGNAFYIYDEDVDEDYVADNPLTASISANSRGFRLSSDQVITPYMVGAQGWALPAGFNIDVNRTQVVAGCPDDADALDAFFDLVCERGYVGDAGGVFGSSTGHSYGRAVLSSRNISMSGDFMLLALAPMNALLTFDNAILLTWHGKITLGGIGGLNWSTRTVKRGLDFRGNSSRVTVTGGVYAAGFAYYGVAEITVDAGEFCEWFSTPAIFGHSVGSGPIEGNPAYNSSLTAAYSDPVNTGDVNSTNQRTTLEVTDWPDEDLEADMDPATLQIYVTIDDRIYQVREFDRVAGTVDISPWLMDDAPTSGTLYYVFGGLLADGGGDGSLANIGVIDAQACASAYTTTNLYVCDLKHVAAQSCCVGIMLRGADSAQLGGVVGRYYPETNMFDLVTFGSPNNSISFQSIAPFNPQKIVAPYPGDGSVGGDASGPGLGKLRIFSADGAQFVWQGQINGGDGTLRPRMDGSTPINWLRTNFATVFLPEYDEGFDRLIGSNTVECVIAGTGTNNAPTQVIIWPPAGNTVDGAASVTFTGFTEPARFLCSADPATGNYTVTRLDLAAEPVFEGLMAAVIDNGDGNTTVTAFSAPSGFYRVEKTGGADNTEDAGAKTAAVLDDDFEIEVIIRNMGTTGQLAFGVKAAPGGSNYATSPAGMLVTGTPFVVDKSETGVNGPLVPLVLDRSYFMKRVSGVISYYETTLANPPLGTTALATTVGFDCSLWGDGAIFDVRVEHV